MPNTPGAHPHFNDRGAVRWYTSLTALLPPEASARRCSLSLAGQLEGRVVSWSRAPFPWRGGQGPTQPAVRGGGY